MDNINIGKRIREAREDKGWLMSELASKIMVANSTITRYEEGTIQKIKMPIIQAIANALDVNPMWIIGKTDEKEVFGEEEVEKLILSDAGSHEVIKAYNERSDVRLLFDKSKNWTEDDIYYIIGLMEQRKKS